MKEREALARDQVGQEAVADLPGPWRQKIDGKALAKLADEKFGVTFAGGQGVLAGKIIRMAHLGYCDDLDVISALSALEMALSDMGCDIPLGAGIKAAEDILSGDNR